MEAELVRRAAERRRFHELGRVLFADEPRWAPPLRSYEAWLFSRGHPFRDRGDVVRFIVRHRGRVVGRICAHSIDGDERGWFGALEVDDDQGALEALLGAARDWLQDRGCTSMTGPATFTAADDPGLLVHGHENAGGTGRPWHPPYYADRLVAAGLEATEPDSAMWRLTAHGAALLRAGGPQPPHAGRFGDERLVLMDDAGAIAAVPDVTSAARATSLRGRPTFDEATVVRCEGDSGVLVPALLGAASAAGYTRVWAPWSPDDRPADARYRRFGQIWPTKTAP